MSEDLNQGFTTSEVARLTPVTLRQLQLWDEQKIIMPKRARGMGHPLARYYSAEDLFGVLLLRELRERGFSLRVSKQIWHRVRERGELSRRWILTNGETHHFLDHADVVLAFLEQRRSPAFRLISLEAIRQRVQEGGKKMRKRFETPATVERREPGSYRPWQQVMQERRA